MDKKKGEEGSGDLTKQEPNLRRGVVFITPNNEYYRNQNLGFGWAITHETKAELTWGEAVEVEQKNWVVEEILKRADAIEKRFEGDEEGLRAFLRRPIVGDIDHRFNGIRCKASQDGGVCSAKKREFEYATENPNNQGTWVCKDCGRLYSEEELLEMSKEKEVCDVCGNPATVGIEQPEGLLLYLCDKCCAERGIEEEEVWGVEQ